MTGRLKVLLSGGGTGGHVYPALTVVAAAESDRRDLEFRFVGTTGGLERDIVAETRIAFEAIDAGAFRGRSPFAAIKSVGHNVHGVAQAIQLIRRYRPDVILATGGFVCVPVVLAGRLLGVPSVVYLPDLRPGWAIRFIARFATAVAVSFDAVVPYISTSRVVVTGYPVRAELGSWDPAAARARLDLPDDRPIVLVLGGSRGARSINEAMIAGAAQISREAYVIHATGPTNYQSVSERIGKMPEQVRDSYRIYPYLNAELAPALTAASIIVARAGASVLGELPRVGVPGILVPGTFAGGHQTLNAEFLASRGAAIVVPDGDLPAGALSRTLLELLRDPARLQVMAHQSRLLAYPRAAYALCDLIESVARRDTANNTTERSL